MTNLTALLERVLEAEGADRELDGDLVEAFNQLPIWPLDIDGNPNHPMEREGGGWYGGGRIWEALEYTASIDAAVALVERVRPGKPWMVGVMSSGKLSAIVDGKVALSLPTPALALLAALLASLGEGE